jgi:hypothetical protein
LSQSYMIVVKVLQTKKCPRSSGLVGYRSIILKTIVPIIAMATELTTKKLI